MVMTATSEKFSKVAFSATPENFSVVGEDPTLEKKFLSCVFNTTEKIYVVH
jgi:hypothetical protein